MTTWLPLELWRASSLAQETRTVEAAYARALSGGDTETLEGLRTSILQRIDDLESFFVEHVDDERAVLFEKQRLKLRKLLHEYHSTAERSRHEGPVAPIRINKDSRLSLTELLAWFIKAGHKEMPGVSDQLVETVFSNWSKHSPDGKLSIKQLREWYTTIHLATPADSASAAGSARKSGSVVSAASGSPSTASKKKKKKAAIYSWEKKALKERRAARTKPAAVLDFGDSSDEERPPLGLKDTVEFQVRLTEEEYKRFILLKRRQEAEDKFMSRANKTIAASKQRRAAVEEERGSSSIAVTGPYVEPSLLESHLCRADQPKKWLSGKDFERVHQTTKAPVTRP